MINEKYNKESKQNDDNEGKNDKNDDERNNKIKNSSDKKNQNVESSSPGSLNADLFLVGRKDGTLDLFQVKILEQLVFHSYQFVTQSVSSDYYSDDDSTYQTINHNI